MSTQTPPGDVEFGMALGGHRKEDRMWQASLANLVAHLGMSGEVDTAIVCVDKRRQWGRVGSIRHDAAIHAIAKPFRRTQQR